MPVEPRRTTRGPPPAYPRILLESTCKNWHKEPIKDPIINDPNQYIAAGHQQRYLLACARRILENAMDTTPFHTLTIQRIKQIIQDYIEKDRELTPEQRAVLFNQYYTETFFNALHELIHKPQSPTNEPKSRSRKRIPLEIPVEFQEIRDELEKRPSIQYESENDLTHSFQEILKLFRIEWNHQHPEDIIKFNHWQFIKIVYKEVFKLILMIENNNNRKLTPTKLNQYTQILNIWQSTFPQKTTLLFSNADDYFSCVLALLKIYLDWRETTPRHATGSTGRIHVYNPMTVNEWKILGQSIKQYSVLLFGLQKDRFLDTMLKNQSNRLEFLEFIPEREVYQYLWLFLTLPYDRTESSIEVHSSKLETVCVELYANIHPYYENFKKEMIGRCSLLKQEFCPDLMAVRKEVLDSLQKKFYVHHPQTTLLTDEGTMPPGTYIPVLINREFALIQFFKLWYGTITVSPQDKPFFWFKYFDVHFEGEEGFFVGVQMDLLQTCMDQLHPTKMNVFIPTYEGSSRYQINRDFSFSDKQYEQLKGYLHTDPTDPMRLTLKNRLLFLEFLGGLLARCVLVGIQAPVKLSYHTLAYLRNTKMTYYDYAHYFMMDHYPKAKPLFNLLSEDPDSLQYIGMEFNDQYPLRDIKQQKVLPIDSASILNYIGKTGRYVLTTLNAQDIPDIGETERAIYKRNRKTYIKCLRAFQKGFFIPSYGLFMEKNIAIYLLDLLIHNGDLRIENLKEFVDNNVKISESSTNGTPKRELEIQRERQMFEWFKHILLDDTIELPYDVMISDSEKIPKIYEFYYKHFIPKLIYFWTGSRSINTEYIHTIAFEFNDPTDVSDPNQQYNKLMSLPKSHTCSKTLDIPIYLMNMEREVFETRSAKDWVDIYLHPTYNPNFWKKEFLRRLCIAVFQTSGFGMAGGTTMVDGMAGGTIPGFHLSKHCIRYVKKHCSIEDYNKAFVCGIQHAIRCTKELTPTQKRKMKQYIQQHPLDFEHARPSQLKKWTCGMIKARLKT